MSWLEQENETRKQHEVSKDRAVVLDQARDETLPVIQKEAAQGEVPFDPLKFQPVRSPGNYEAEFAKRGEDVIFHFWPYGYHEADRRGIATPKFKPEFLLNLRVVMISAYGAQRVEVSEDRDMGAWFVKAHGWGAQQFWFDLACEACRKLHHSLGGE